MEREGTWETARERGGRKEEEREVKTNHHTGSVCTTPPSVSRRERRAPNPHIGGFLLCRAK